MSNIIQQLPLRNVRDYSSTQRLGFAGIAIGLVMCGVGCFAPYWKSGEISLEVDIPFIQNVKVIDINGGLWIFCYDLMGVAEECGTTTDLANTFSSVKKFFHIGDTSEFWLGVTYLCSMLCLGLTLLCAFAACCRSCCCSGGRTVCHGIMTFFAACSGIVVSVAFVAKADAIYGLPLVDLDYGWAFYLFTIGACILFVSSFLLCCGAPNPVTYGIISAPSAPSVVVQTSTSNQSSMMVGPQVHNPNRQEMSAMGYDQGPTSSYGY